MPQDPNLFLSLGKEIKDEYGRVVGEVVSLAVKPDGRIDSVYVRHSDGRFAKYPVENFKVEGSEAISISKIKVETAVLCNQIPLVWRKDQALKELLEKKKISPQVYEDLHNSFEGALNQLKNQAQALMRKVDEEIERCAREIMELNYALVHLEVEHEIGEINEQSYQAALSRIQECLKRTYMEKADLESVKNKLSNMLLGEPLDKSITEIPVAEKTQTPPSPALPEPPMVIYVKEAGESNI
ncbi:MAG: CdvA-like protein [Nitrososphaerota archaeon]|nr:CdvA-like protein [Candidatus Bathyarchaeota archaeon]MDW8024084.1 CdvA-like protein [Nitrososphaerota archaeon]